LKADPLSRGAMKADQEVRTPIPPLKWVVMGLSMALFLAVLIFVLGFTPDRSNLGLMTGSAMAAVLVLCVVLTRRTGKWWAQLGVLLPLSGLFMAIGVRMILEFASTAWVWTALTVGVFAFVWALPWIRPDISGVLHREQLSPRTSIGRGCLRVSAALLPIAGLIGGFGGVILGRAKENMTESAITGGLGLLLGIGLGQYSGHSVWTIQQRQKQPSDRHGSPSI
jgi:hypothetical protein